MAPQKRLWKSLTNTGSTLKMTSESRTLSRTDAMTRLTTEARGTPSAVVRTGTRANPAGATGGVGATVTGRRTTCTGRGPVLGAWVAGGAAARTVGLGDCNRTWLDHATPSHHR